MYFLQTPFFLINLPEKVKANFLHILLVENKEVGPFLLFSLLMVISYCLFASLIFYFLFRDGTSIILSDDVGQLYILNTGQGESQKDAKYDQVIGKSLVNLVFRFEFGSPLDSHACVKQFFLGDYRPLVQDANGNVLDQVHDFSLLPVV